MNTSRLTWMFFPVGFLLILGKISEIYNKDKSRLQLVRPLIDNGNGEVYLKISLKTYNNR
jgi:hypothetical protein